MTQGEPTYKRLIHHGAKALSVLFYPLLIPTYGMALYCLIMAEFLPVRYSVTVCLATLFFTCFIPVSLILFMWWKKQIPDLYIDDARQRTTPYLYSILGFGFWTWFVIRTMHAPLFLQYVSVSATAALVAVAFINLTWKISAHLTAMGGLLGGICCFAYATQTWPIGFIAAFLGLSLLLMVARIEQKAHTPEQVVAGYLLGLATTTIPYFCIHYV